MLSRVPPFDVDQPPTLCPRCHAAVEPQANRCSGCGEYFPNVEQRQGDIVGGILCGTVRGVGTVAAVLFAVALLRLVLGRFDVGNLCLLVISLAVFSACLPIASKLDKRTYHVD